MLFWKQTLPQTEEENPITPLGRWWQALSGNIFSLILLNLVIIAFLLPAIACVWAFLTFGGLVLIPAILVAFGLAGAAYTAVSKSIRELQFGMPVYLWKALFGYFKQYFWRGFTAGIICTSLLALVLLVIIIGTQGILALPLLIVICLTFGIFLLIPIIFYTFEQLTQMELRMAAVFKNSLLLIFAMGWRSVLLNALWLLPATLLMLFPNIIIPLCILPGLPALLCLSGQAITHAKLNRLFGEAVSK